MATSEMEGAHELPRDATSLAKYPKQVLNCVGKQILFMRLIKKP